MLSCWDVFKLANKCHEIRDSLLPNYDLLKWMSYENCIHYVLQKNIRNRDLFCAVCKIGFDCRLALGRHLNEPSHFFLHFDRFKILIDDKIKTNHNLYFSKYSFGKFIEYVDNNTFFCNPCGINLDLHSNLLNHFSEKSHWFNFNDKSPQRVPNIKIESGLKSLEMPSSSSTTKRSKSSNIVPKKNTLKNKAKQQTSKADIDKHSKFMGRISNIEKTFIIFYCQACNYYEFPASDFEINLHATSLQHEQFTNLKVNLAVMKFTWNTCNDCSIKFFCSFDFYLYHNQSNEHRVCLKSVKVNKKLAAKNGLVPKPYLSNINSKEILKNGVLDNLQILEKRKNVNFKDCIFNYCTNCNVQVSLLSNWNRHLTTPDHKRIEFLKPSNKTFACDCDRIYFCDNDFFSKHLTAKEHMYLKLIVNNRSVSKHYANIDKNNHKEMIKNGIQELLQLFLFHQNKIRNRNWWFNYCSVCCYSTKQVHGWKNHINSFDHKYNMNLKPDNKLFKCFCKCSLVCVDEVYANHQTSEEHKNLISIVGNLQCHNKFYVNAGKKENLQEKKLQTFQQCLLKLTGDVTKSKISEAFKHLGQIKFVKKHPNELMLLILSRTEIGFGSIESTIFKKNLFYKIELKKSAGYKNKRFFECRVVNVFEKIFDKLVQFYTNQPSRIEICNETYGFCCVPCEFFTELSKEWSTHINRSEHKNKVSNLLCKETFCDCFTTIISDDIFFSNHKKSTEHHRLKNVISSKKKEISTRKISFGEQDPNVSVSVSNDLVKSIHFYNITVDLNKHIERVIKENSGQFSKKNKKLNYGLFCCLCLASLLKNKSCSDHLTNNSHMYNTTLEPDYKQYNCDCGIKIICDQDFYSIHQTSDGHNRLKDIIQQKLMNIKTNQDSENVDINRTECKTFVNRIETKLFSQMDFNLTSQLIYKFFENIFYNNNVLKYNKYYIFFCFPCNYIGSKHHEWLQHVDGEDHKKNLVSDLVLKFHSCNCNSMIFCNDEFYLYHTTTAAHRNADFLISYINSNIQKKKFNRKIFRKVTSKFEPSMNYVPSKEFESLIKKMFRDFFYGIICGNKLKTHYLFYCTPCNFVETKESLYIHHVRSNTHYNNHVISNQGTIVYECDCCITLICDENFYLHHLESIEHYVLKLVISQRLEEIKSKLPFVSSDYEDEDNTE